jgi:hypothetical protein
VNVAYTELLRFRDKFEAGEKADLKGRGKMSVINSSMALEPFVGPWPPH